MGAKRKSNETTNVKNSRLYKKKKTNENCKNKIGQTEKSHK